MPTLTYTIEVRCLNCKYEDITTVRRGCRWVNANQNNIGSCYYKNNDPSKRVKKACSFCGCDALKKVGLVLPDEQGGADHEE